MSPYKRSIEDDVSCQVDENGVIIFCFGNFRRVHHPDMHYQRNRGKIRDDMISYGIYGGDVDSILDMGYVESLKIREIK